MKLSTRARYGTRAILDMAIHYREGLVSVKDVAERQQISERYLEQLILPLKAAGLVNSVRGAHGGCILARTPSHIKLREVIEALEGPIDLVECVDDPDTCPHAITCVTRDVWDEVQRAIDGVLESITLQDLVERHREKAQPGSAMFYI